jgi:hypothetical protein
LILWTGCFAQPPHFFLSAIFALLFIIPMKTMLICALILILLAGGIMLYRDGYVKRRVRKQVERQYHIVAPLIKKLDSQLVVSKSELLMMVSDPALRFAVYCVLKVYKRIDLFPLEYFNREKGAECFLVKWLEYPTELGNSPGEIEFLTKVIIQDHEPLDYYVFRYKTKTHLHSSDQNWLLGVCGPYQNDSQPYDLPLRVFSRFNTEDQMSPEQEAKWVHENIHKSNS